MTIRTTKSGGDAPFLPISNFTHKVPVLLEEDDGDVYLLNKNFHTGDLVVSCMTPVKYCVSYDSDEDLDHMFNARLFKQFSGNLTLEQQ